MDLFRVRLNCVDHYQSIPTQFDPQLRNNVAPSQKQNEPRVPVIRVFGSTETGQKVCAHIHGAFPYLYVEYDGSLVPDEVGAYIHRLHLSIDHALGVTYRRNIYDGKSKFVARITLVKGIPFYGFYVGYRYFLKIYMLNPMVMTRLSDLLREGAIMKKTFQPFEAHLQFILQWMTDYNLYGCGYIDCQRPTFRHPVPPYEDMDGNSTHLWHDRSVPVEYITQHDSLPRSSHCSIEVDILVQDILNRAEIQSRPLHHDFVERLNPLPPGEKLVHSMAGLWRDETLRRKSRMGILDDASSPFPPEVMASMSASPRKSQSGGWIHEEEYMEMVRNLIIDEGNNSNGSKSSFENFVTQQPFEKHVRTVFESVEDLFPENLRPALGLKSKTEKINPGETKKYADVDIDEDHVYNFEDDENNAFPYDSDEDFMREIELSQRNQGHLVNQLKSSTKIPGDSFQAFKVGESGTGLKRDTHAISNNPVLSAQPIETIYEEEAESGGSETLDSCSIDPESFPPSKTKFRQRGMISTALNDSSNHGIKRPQSRLGALHTPSKRQRIGSESPQRNNGFDRASGPDVLDLSKPALLTRKLGVRPSQGRSLASSERLTVNGVPRADRKGPETIPKGPSQEESWKSNGTLSFPVVKDPYEPSTILRLSQGSPVEQALDPKSRKQVSTEANPFLSSQDVHSLETLSSSSAHSARTALLESSAVCSIRHHFDVPKEKQLFVLAALPPTAIDVEKSMRDFGVPQIIYQDAYYSNEGDVPERPREWAGREFRLESITVPFLPQFDASGSSAATFGEKQSVILDKPREEAVFRHRRRNCGLRSWEIGEPPPALSEVLSWWEESENLSQSLKSKEASRTHFSHKEKTTGLPQLEGPTQNNKHGFKFTQKQNSSAVKHDAQYMSTMSLEVHVNTRGNLVPNPEEDEVQCVFWCLQSDEDGLISNGIADGTQVGIVVLSEDGTATKKVCRHVEVGVQEEASELDLLVRIVEIVRTHDPDILTGYEVHGGSWGYLIERARFKYDYNLCDEFSRMKTQSHGRFGKDSDKWGFNTTSTIRVTGRHMINIWRAMRSELNLLQYTMENVVFHLLHIRVPHYSWRDLTNWYSNGKPRHLAKLLDYYVTRVQLDLAILEHNELIARTSEQARLLGVDFFSVFSRGSQFKVESLMFRIAKPESFLLVSPSRKQIGGQNALECLPLVMEPQSAFYNGPLLVLDFQSLYPSVMIAYNYCYSTFLGRIVNWRGTNKMGFTDYKRQQGLLELLQDHINIAPNGMMFVKPEIRKSLLAKMLGEILETRVMVKSGMRVEKEDKALQRLLNNRQLALKLIANVTYGYTSASFSGRMPCSEIADSIVQTSRETLEKAIALIHSVERWGAEVVYGDTDSLFIYLKGRSKDQAFDIGDEIAKEITNMNPRPVKLKFEKVYFPCVLLAKKRYVGFKYDSKEQTEPEFDAKGIETVRRDGTPAEQKIEESALKILFRTADLTQVKNYFQSQCEKIMKGSVSIQDFCFAREVKLGTYSEKGIPPPGALISTKRMLEDARAEPQYGERVPYVVVTGAPGARLIDRCVAPETLLFSDHNDLDAEYYISKNIIPPLERIFNLVGANVRTWYDEMPKVQRIRRVDANLQLHGHSNELTTNKKTLESYLKSSSCLVCKDKMDTEGSICGNCLAHRQSSLLTLRTRLNEAEKKFRDVERVCQSCSGITWSDEVKCDSKDCPVFYTRTKQKAMVMGERATTEPVMTVLQSMDVNLYDLEW